jgi:hypothetical protein
LQVHLGDHNTLLDGKESKTQDKKTMPCPVLLSMRCESFIHDTLYHEKSKNYQILKRKKAP